MYDVLREHPGGRLGVLSRPHGPQLEVGRLARSHLDVRRALRRLGLRQLVAVLRDRAHRPIVWTVAQSAAQRSYPDEIA